MNRAERRAHMRAHNRARFSAPLWSAVTSHRFGLEPEPKAATSRRTPGRLNFQIQQLVLHGFPLKTRHAVSEATQTELTRLLTSSGLPAFLKDPIQSDRIDGGNFNVTSATKPQTLGSLIANAVYGGQWR